MSRVRYLITRLIGRFTRLIPGLIGVMPHLAVADFRDNLPVGRHTACVAGLARNAARRPILDVAARDFVGDFAFSSAARPISAARGRIPADGIRPSLARFMPLNPVLMAVIPRLTRLMPRLRPLSAAITPMSLHVIPRLARVRFSDPILPESPGDA